MSFPNSPGVYARIKDESFIASLGGIVGGGIVITSEKGPVEPTVITSGNEFIKRYGVPTANDPSKHCATRFLERAGILTVARATNASDIVATAGIEGQAGANVVFDVSAANPGSWGNNLSITLEDASQKEGNGRFYLVVTDGLTEVERFLVSRDPQAKSGYNTTQFIEDVVNRDSTYITVVNKASVTDSLVYDTPTSLTGGSNATTYLDGDIVDCWDKFRNTEDINVTFLINAGFATQAVQVEMDAVAKDRKDAIAILDVDDISNDDAANIITFRDGVGLNSHFSALYGGWIKVYDQFNDKIIEIPPSGDVAANMVITVQDYAYWEAPAGLTRGVINNALGVTKVFDEGERDLLYDAGVNPVTTHGGVAAIIWGQKTMQIQNSSLDKVNVMNTVLYLNNNMKEALLPFVFQPNTKTTRDNVNRVLTNFLENIRKRGGLYDFAVDTSTEINTPFVIDNNQLLVNVAIQPTQTAEFIRLTTTIKPTGVELS